MRKKILIFLFLFFIILSFLIYPYLKFLNQEVKISFLKTIFSLEKVKKDNDQTNILLLGISGKNHDGPNLSDTIMVLNYHYQKNKLNLISLPRDLWSETLKDKINSAYAYGEAKKPNQGGFILAKAEVSYLINQPIHYVVVIDFDGFKNLIDALGGIDIYVENSFTDNNFPIEGKENDLCGGDPQYRCRYETITFKKGLNHLNGETALKYIRSRHSSDNDKEGTDFAREKRQQQVIDAIKNKLIKNLKTLNLNSLKKFYLISEKMIKKDISNQQLAQIGKNIFFKKNFSLEKITLPETLLINPPPLEKYNYAWVLLPKNEDIKIIQNYLSCYFEEKNLCQNLNR